MKKLNLENVLRYIVVGIVFILIYVMVKMGLIYIPWLTPLMNNEIVPGPPYNAGKCGSQP